MPLFAFTGKINATTFFRVPPTYRGTSSTCTWTCPSIKGWTAARPPRGGGKGERGMCTRFVNEQKTPSVDPWMGLERCPRAGRFPTVPLVPLVMTKNTELHTVDFKTYLSKKRISRRRAPLRRGCWSWRTAAVYSTSTGCET